MRICITISEREKKDLALAAKTMRVSMGAMVRIALSDYIHGNFICYKKVRSDKKRK